MEWKRTRSKENRIQFKREKSLIKEEILKRRIVNLSTLELTHSETDLLRRGLNFCPTPPPPKPESVDKDIDAFARRLNLKEYHAPNEIDEMENQSAYKPSILEKLNKKERVQYYRPSREPYINSYVEKLREGIKEEVYRHQRFQRNNLNKRERAALSRLRDNKKIITKPADKGGATVILNTEDYITEAMCQLLKQCRVLQKSRKRLHP